RGVKAQDAGTGVLNGLNEDGRIGIIANVGDVLSTESVENKKAVVVEDNHPVVPLHQGQSDWYTYTYQTESDKLHIHVNMRKGWECDEWVQLSYAQENEDSVKEIVRQVAQRCLVSHHY
ncbi:hypothetical protein E4U21_005468, partial [Claviceps maximensis]